MKNNSILTNNSTISSGGKVVKLECNFFERLLVSLSVVACNFRGQSRCFADVNTKNNAVIAFSKDKCVFDKLRNCESQISEKANISVIGEKNVGKYKIVGSLLANTKKDNFPTGGIKMPENCFEHNKIYVALNNENLRIIELDIEEFLKLDSDSTEMKYLILDTTWVIYVVNETNCRVDKMLSVYDKINKCYCKNYKINYDNYSIYQSKEWFINLKRVMHIGDQLFCGFTLIANVENKNLDKYLIESYKEMTNGKKVFYVNYNSDKFVPPIPSDLINLLDERCDVTVISKTSWNRQVPTMPLLKKFTIRSVASLALGLIGYGIYKGCTSKNKKQDIKQLKLNDEGRINGITKRYKQRNQFRVQQIKRITNQKNEICNNNFWKFRQIWNVLMCVINEDKLNMLKQMRS